MREFWRKLRQFRRRNELAARLNEELDFHRALAGGEIGNRARILEQSDDVWSLGWLERMGGDLRYASRTLARSKAFFALAAIGTALGVSALTAVVSVTNTVLVRSIPYRDPGRLVVVSDQLLKLNFPRFPLSIANYLDYRAGSRVFEDIAAFEPRPLTITGAGGAERVAGMMASANLLTLLGTAPASGRWFQPAENHAGHDKVAVLSYLFAQSHREPVIRVNDELYEVVGVLPRGFAFRLSGDAPQVWLPVLLDFRPRDIGNLRAIARLKPGVSLQSAQVRMHLMAADLKQRYHAGMGPHGEDGGYDCVVIPIRQELYGAAQPTLLALAGASAILLLLGLANTALLWMGRAAARRKEAAVRVALGASRARVAQQFVLEALLPSLTGGILALALSLAALAALNHAPPAELATVDAFALDYRVFLFTLSLSALAGILFGVLPLDFTLRAGIEGQGLAQERGSTTGRQEAHLRQVLVALQVGLVCALLAPALLLTQGLAALEHIDPGVRTDRLVTGYVSVPAAHAPDPAVWYRHLESTLHDRLGDAVTLASVLPLSQGSGGDPFSIEGRAYGVSGTLPQMAHTLRVGRGYFDLMRIRVLSGRAFEPRDFAEPTHVAIVNRTLAQAFWSGQSPLGKRILMGAPSPGVEWRTIVGVAADIHTTALNEPPLPQIYFPYSQLPSRTMAIVADSRRSGDLSAAVHDADPAVPLFSVRTMEQRVAASVERPRLRAELFACYGGLAFALAAFGIYSMAVYAALRRRREFALRIALGATRGRLMGSMLSGTLAPATIGAVAGVAAGYLISHALAAFLYGTGAASVRVYFLSAALPLAVAVVATGLGGRGSLSADAAGLLREE